MYCVDISCSSLAASLIYARRPFLFVSANESYMNFHYFCFTLLDSLFISLWLHEICFTVVIKKYSTNCRSSYRFVLNALGNTGTCSDKETRSDIILPKSPVFDHTFSGITFVMNKNRFNDFLALPVVQHMCEAIMKIFPAVLPINSFLDLSKVFIWWLAVIWDHQLCVLYLLSMM